MTEERLIAVASEDSSGLDGQVSPHFGRCPFYVLVHVNGDTVIRSQVVANPHFGEHRPGMMPRFIHGLGANVIIAGGMGPRAVDMFHGFGMDVATGAIGTVEQVLEAYLRGEHRGVVPCAHDHPDSCGVDGRRGGGNYG